jgi:hypothetical protein
MPLTSDPPRALSRQECWLAVRAMRYFTLRLSLSLSLSLSLLSLSLSLRLSSPVSVRNCTALRA